MSAIIHPCMSPQRNSRIRIKFCGLTRPQDVQRAVALGVDEIGLVFAGSRRKLDTHTASKLATLVHDLASGRVQVTGLFMNHSSAAVSEVLAQVALDRLQFHGAETAEFCAAFGRPWIKAIAVTAADDVVASLQQWSHWQQQQLLAMLLDAHAGNQPGGTGEVFDWSLIPQQRPLPIYLAGGLTPDNVAAAIRQLRPETVDVSSGIETSPGCKCPDKMQAFVNEVNHVFESGQS